MAFPTSARKPSMELSAIPGEIGISLSIMQGGCSLTKLRQNKLYPRRYFLSDDKTSIRWEPSKKRFEESKILVAEIKEIKEGQTTTNFQESKELVGNKERLSFSIIFKDSEAEPLDLIAETEQEYTSWLIGLTHLVSTFLYSLNLMKKGTLMTKVRPKKLYQRTYCLSPDMKSITWSPSKKGEQGMIEIEEIKFIRMGQKTAAFHKAKVNHLEHLSFSLIYGDEFETLDLIAENISDYKIWTSGIQHLVAGFSDSLKIMEIGNIFNLVRSKQKDRPLRFFLSEDNTSIQWDTSKKDDKSRILIGDIKEIRRGQATPSFQSRNDLEYLSELSFSIVYGEDFKTLDLIAESPTVYSHWITGLMYLASNSPSKLKNETDKKPTINSEIESAFRRFNKDGSGFLSQDEIADFLHELNIGLDVKQIKKSIKKFAEGNDLAGGRFGLDEFTELFEQLSERKELVEIIKKYADEDDEPGTFGPDGIKKFLVAEMDFQEEDVTFEYCSWLIERFEPSHDARIEGYMKPKGLANMLLSNYFDIFDPNQDVIFQDMEKPLSHYFISSSHNTYLLEDQLKGPSSIEAYKKALLKGCRCIELDCWDGEDGNPIIYHGRTLTSKILFEDVVKTIAEYAFKVSPYPLILSIENHCSVPQQVKMASIMKAHFKDSLDVPPIDHEMEYLPSPESLRNKILIKGKKLSETQMASNDDYVTDEDDDEHEEEVKHKQKKEKTQKKRIRLARELSDLVTYIQSKSFESFEEEKRGEFFHVSSLSEGECKKILQEEPQSMVDFTRHQLARVFPAGIRVDSSNYNPQEMWNMGCQLVALNFQKNGLYMQINQAKFRQNGICGYVLKPRVMWDPDNDFNPVVNGPVPHVTAKTFGIEIISGQQIPKPNGPGKKGKLISPYVMIEIFGLPQDTTSKQTKSVANNGFSPVWSQSFDLFVQMPELAIVRFSVYDQASGGDFIGQYSAPLDCLRPGYRHIHLENEKGDPLPFASLFVKIQISSGGRSSHWQMAIRGIKDLKAEELFMKERRAQIIDLQLVGVAAMDNHFKEISTVIERAALLRENLLLNQERLKDSLGLPISDQLQRTLRTLSYELNKESNKMSLQVVEEKGKVSITPKVQKISVRLRKIINNFNSLTDTVTKILEEAPKLQETINKATVFSNINWPDLEETGSNTNSLSRRVSNAFQFSKSREYPPPTAEELQQANVGQYLSRMGFKDKKLAKAKKSYGWNIQKLKSSSYFLTDCLQQISDIRRLIKIEILQRDDISEETTNSVKMFPRFSVLYPIGDYGLIFDDDS